MTIVEMFNSQIITVIAEQEIPHIVSFTVQLYVHTNITALCNKWQGCHPLHKISYSQASLESKLLKHIAKACKGHNGNCTSIVKVSSDIRPNCSTM